MALSRVSLFPEFCPRPSLAPESPAQASCGQWAVDDVRPLTHRRAAPSPRPGTGSAQPGQAGDQEAVRPGPSAAPADAAGEGVGASKAPPPDGVASLAEPAAPGLTAADRVPLVWLLDWSSDSETAPAPRVRRLLGRSSRTRGPLRRRSQSHEDALLYPGVPAAARRAGGPLHGAPGAGVQLGGEEAVTWRGLTCSLG